MRTKTLLLLILFLGIGLTRLSAQDWPPFIEPDGTRSMAFSSDWFCGYTTPVFCNGEQVDFLTGTAYGHCVWHYVNGVYMWARVSSHGEATGQYGEIFKVQEIDKEIWPLSNPWHVNLIGDRGSHYILFITWDFVNDPDGEHLIINRAICLRNGKK